ncbi:hypothetical protein Lal_00039939, partial [Lupinus albus]
IHTIKTTKPPLCVCEYKVYFLFFKVLYDFRMGNTGHLHPINPEIDRTYHMLVRQSTNLPFHSVPDSVSDSDSISDSILVSVHSVQYTDFVHSVALSDSEHSENSVHSENMAQPPTPPGPRERTLRELLERKIDSLTTLVTQLAMNQQKQPMARVCGICTSPDHYTQQQPPHAPFQNNNAAHNRPYVPPPIQQQRQQQ